MVQRLSYMISYLVMHAVVYSKAVLLHSQPADGVLGFIKASDLVGKYAAASSSSLPHLQEDGVVTARDKKPQLATSFIPALKLLGPSLSSRKQVYVAAPAVSEPTSESTTDALSKRQHGWINSGEDTSILAVEVVDLDDFSHPSTSSGSIPQLKTVHIYPDDLYDEAASDSSVEDLAPVLPVSGPGMGFQRASSLAFSSAQSVSLELSTDVVPSVKSTTTSHRVSSTASTIGRGGRGGGRGKHTSATARTQPKIANLFKK